ncbi:iron-siderophore ABC transporter substrate-binding protein [Mastigocoleus testarum]|uniref:Iron siderophore-binding protein n=1 Tax=Mastigocoleus testarum BC008 TaxID=371196 RepID=A0A0V7ZNZ9_9CYAN|nr:iron-siderophore ABC transporter substrate-binding protein [Mastigocoleus testarum]KST65990.1 iron siderophore-binding protein [Mastigocoleus testarum BC008]
MKNRLYRYLKLFLILSLPFLLITAFYSQVTQKVDTPNTQLAISDCRVVVSQLGKTCVPLQPERIIVTDEVALDAVLGLGLKPVATAEANLVSNEGAHLTGKLEGVTSLGKRSQTNVERMVKLHPDLIVGFFMNSQNYGLFPQIAPTIKLDVKYVKGTWKDSLLEIAEVLGRTKEAENAIANYQQRIIKLRKAIEHKFGKIEVSVTRFYGGRKNLPQFDTVFSFSGGILQELGLSVPPEQIELTTDPDTFSVPVSLERIDLLDADVLFVMLDPGAEENFKRYQESPLWQKLNVVQNKRVYTVDSSYWWLGNILAANAILDDLNKYLINTPDQN